MGNFSDDTFDPKKHYVGVRLQQGVPLVDADWNEQEDIRKNELQSFLKWFVGNGVPKGANNRENDGFKIEPVAGGGVNTIVLTSNRQEPGLSSIEIDLEASSAASTLGFVQGNTSRWGSSPARLTGNSIGDQDKKFNIQKGMTLTVKVDDSEEKKILFKQEGTYFASELVEVINSYGPEIFTASVGTGNDFVIKGGDGTTDGAGRCLVEGLEVLNERDIKYTEQKLYENDDLADKWDVDPIEKLSPPESDERKDLVYLDVWEREVDSIEEETLLNPAIGVETCVRLKREWAVRVKVGESAIENPSTPNLPNPPQDHVFYSLAVLNRSKEKGNEISEDDITTDLRRTGLAVLSKEITIKDGKVGIGNSNPDYELDVNGVIRALNGLHVQGGSAKFVTDNGANPLIISKDPESQEENELRINFDNEKSGLFHCISNAESNKIFFRMQNTQNDNIVMTIVGNESGGGVGIGKTDPEYRLDVDHAIRAGRFLIESNQVTFAFDAWQGNLAIGKLIASGSPDIAPIFYPQLILTPDGNIGIGTEDPEYGLDINGNNPTIGAREIISREIIRIKGEGSDWQFANLYGNLSIRLEDFSSPEESNKDNKLTLTRYRDIIMHDFWIFTTNANNDLNIHPVQLDQNSEYISTVLYITKEGNVGIGTEYPGDDKLDVRGHIYYSGGCDSTDMDYAEYFESANGLAIPAGTSVVLAENGTIRPSSKKAEIPIGIISQNPAIAGNSYKEWPKKYLRDEFGNRIIEEYQEEIMVPRKGKVVKKRQKIEKKAISEEVKRKDVIFKKGKYIQIEITETVTREVEEPLFEEVDLYDSEGKNIIGKHRIPVMETYEEEIELKDENGKPVFVGSGEFVAKKRPKINPEYDESKEYIPRRDRPEWNCVGLLGQLPLRKGQPVAESWVKIKDISDEVELWLVK